MLQNPIMANITHFVETHGEANSNSSLPFDQSDIFTLDEPSYRFAQQLT